MKAAYKTLGLTLLLAFSGLSSNSQAAKKGRPSPAKTACLAKDPDLKGQDLKKCIKDLRAKNKKNK